LSEYECPKCKRVYSGTERSKSQFCPECGMYLRPKYKRETRVETSSKKAVEIETLELTRDQVNVYTLFEEFMRLKDFPMGESKVGDDVPSWISDRKRAYLKFQKRFSKQVISDPQTLHDNFKAFLYFKNNFSWTTLYRSGTKALKHLKNLRSLLLFLQDESVPIQKRVDQGLGKKHVEGIGIAILTGLLHTFFPEKYGVWNSRTTDTLNKIRRKPFLTANVGRSYLLINKELKQLAKELNTDLPTIDGFMWFISKRIKIIT
jgi:hypothetical protein